MPRTKSILRELFDTYRGAMAYVEVVNREGTISIGSSWHIGDGVFITAKHVVENMKIKSVATTETYYVPDDDGSTEIAGEAGKFRSVTEQALTIKDGPFFHEDEKIDLASFTVNKPFDLPSVPLGGHLDDWIQDSRFLLTRTLIMGYPPVPFSDRPVLVAATAEINCIIDKYTSRHPHFIISATPRGGFSGGLCLIEWQAALGVIVEALIQDNKDTENGFMSVITVEPIYHLLNQHKILPECQTNFY